MDHVNFMEYKGTRILYLDFSGDPVVIIDSINAARKIIDREPEKSLNVLTDVSNSKWNHTVSEHLKEFTKTNTPHIKHSAVVGVTGLKRVVLRAVKAVTGRDFVLFDKKEDAMDWLASQEKMS